MKRILKIAISLLFASGIAVSCDLEPEIELSLTEDDVVRSYNNTQARLNALYTYLPDGLQYIGGAMLASASDEAEFTDENNAIQNYNLGSWNSLNNPDGAWGRYFNGIYAANLFLQTADKVELDYYKLDPDPSQQEAYKTRLANMKRWKYEARFLRAFFYFELVCRYGAVPVMEHTYGLDSDYMHVSRGTLQECFDFIIDECDSVALKLPPKYEGETLGRASKGAALALKSRALLYAASELFNNSSWYGGYPAPELVTLPEGDRKERWKKAADAASEVLALVAEAGYEFATDYVSLFRSYDNPEIIFTRRSGSSNAFEFSNYPVGYDNGGSGNTPTQNLVDAYEMKEDGQKFDWNKPEHSAEPYKGRDPRLEYTILTNNAEFKGRSLECWTGGRDGRGVVNASKTGYYIRKYIDPNVNLLLGQSSVHTWIIFRLSEIYLNYAEAMNEVYGPNGGKSDGYPMTALEALNAVRTRSAVGMPAVESSSRDDFRNMVRHERRVELAFEGHRLWDVRRWMIAKETLGCVVHGVEITRRGGSYTYKPVEIEKRVFSDKMYMYPIPQNDLNISGWTQNPLW